MSYPESNSYLPVTFHSGLNVVTYGNTEDQIKENHPLYYKLPVIRPNSKFTSKNLYGSANGIIS